MIAGRPFIALLLLCALSACAGGTPITEWRHGDTREEALICIPKGEPPFPAVVFNHGGVVDNHGLEGAAFKGYDLRGICEAFSQSGFLAFMPIRRGGLQGHGEDHLRLVGHAFAAVKARADVDSTRISVAGFSRGGLLTFLAAVRVKEPIVQSFVCLAPAPGKPGVLQDGLSRVDAIKAPVLVMVEQGDQAIVIEVVDQMETALLAAGKPHKIVRYDRGNGHALFMTASYFWPDLISFLRNPEQEVDTPKTVTD